MYNNQNNHRFFHWLLLGLSAVLFFTSLGKAPLYILDEAKNAECAREMFERSDWIIPTFNGQLRTDKPPLHYFFMFGGYTIFGITEWGARFFSAVMGLLTIMVTWFFTSRHSNKLHAFISCLVLLASTHFLFQFRMSVPDPYLIFFNVSAIFTGYSFFKEKKNYWLWLCAIAMGLGTLTKGPVAIIIPGGVIFFWLMWEQRLKEILKRKILLASFIAIAIPLPWYLAVHKATNGAWTKGFFLEHNLNRFSSTMEGHGGLFILIPLFVFVGLLPASPFVGEALKNFKSRFSNPFMKLAFCAAAVYVIFYSFSGTKLPNYPIPGYAFFAIIIGYYFQQVLEWNSKIKWYPFIILLVINLALPIAAYFGLKNEIALSGYENYAAVLLLLPIAVITGLFFARKGKPAYSLIALFCFYTLFNLLFFYWLYPKIYSQNPMSKTINEVKKYDEVVSYKIFQPSYAFYLPARIKVFEEADSLMNYLKHHSAIIITRKEFVGDFKPGGLKTIAMHHNLFETPTTVLLTNKK